MLFYFAINPFSSNELKQQLKCMFNEKLSTEFLFLKEVEDVCATCTKCLPTFTIHHGGRSDITDNMTTRRHKSAEEASASTLKASKYFKTTVREDHDLTRAAAEGAFTCHCDV
jgi:hypothetical protein